MAQNFPHDAIAAVSHPDPYPYYATLVAERPLYYDEPLTSWVASSAEAVTAVLSSNLCGVRPAAEPIPTSLIGSGAGEVFRQFIRMNDRDDRLHIKRALAVAIDSIDAARVSDITERYAGLLLQPGDLPSTFAFQLPIYVIADLLGVPGDDLPWVSGLIDDFVRCLAPGSGAKAIEQGKTSADRLSSYFRSLVADRPHASPVLLPLFAHVESLRLPGIDNRANTLPITPSDMGRPTSGSTPTASRREAGRPARARGSHRCSPVLSV